MTKKYTLYLDESETHKFDPTTRCSSDFHFCMAGIIVDDSNYVKFENSVIDLKKNVWSELQNPQDIILHQMRILEAEKGRLDRVSYPEYAKFNRKEERKKFYDELKNVFQDNDIIIIGSSINEDNLKKYYQVSGRNKQDQYLVAMQLLLENYCHFLCTQNAIGNIIYEFRELKGNEKLRDKYYHMKLMGSMYMTKNAAEKHLLGIDFVKKDANESGLQIADFIPNSFARDHAGIRQSQPNIWGTLRYNLYDGNMDSRERFGVKYMP